GCGGVAAGGGAKDGGQDALAAFAGADPTQIAPDELLKLTDKLEIHRDAIRQDERILVVDDVLATGGTAAAAARLIETLGGTIVGFGFLIEIAGLAGRRALGSRRVESLTGY
ncbi:MAG: phosphoribosyltransferase family protein, partial [Ilumatobacteraceae bacterium]